MTTDGLEQLVRQAQQRKAASAPDPDRVRRALPGLAARRAHRRRAGVVGGALLTVAALLSAFVFWPGTGGTPAPIPADETPSASPSTVPPVPNDMVLSYAPRWLPPGFRERLRGAASNDLGVKGVKVIRSWTKASSGAGGDAPFIRLVMQPGPELPPGTPVTANGVTGSYRGPTAELKHGQLGWPAGPSRAIWIDSNAVTSQAELVRIATSLYPDTNPIVQPLVIGWTPFEYQEYTYSYGGDSPTAWTATVSLYGTEKPANASVSLGPTTDVPAGGEPVEVGGVVGRLAVDETRSRQCVVLPRPGGRYLLTVCNAYAGDGGARMPEDQLLRVAGSVDTTMRAPTDWLG